jgi:ribose-phosphate pyrophosphokinase
MDYPQTLFCTPEFNIDTNFEINRGQLNVGTFPDGWPNLKIENVEETVTGKTVYILADFSKPHQLFRNFSIIYALTRYYPEKVHVICPFLPTGTMERVTSEGEIATAKTFFRMMNATPASEAGITTWHTFDIHDERERFYCSDNISFRLWNTTKLLKKELSKKEKIKIAFPDEGAAKRFSRHFSEYEQIICSKVRNGEKREITIKEGDCKNAEILLLDDLIQSGETLLQTAKVLKINGAKTVGAYATHGIFPNQSYLKICNELDYLWTTNSIPENSTKGIQNFKCLSLAPLLEEIILCKHGK